MLDLLLKKYLFILNKFYKKIVMSFTANHVEGTSSIQQQNKSLSPNQLTAKEIEILLFMVKKTTFLGEDIEPLYNLVIKLQGQYNEQIK
jgi:hypothetical protein